MNTFQAPQGHKHFQDPAPSAPSRMGRKACHVRSHFEAPFQPMGKKSQACFCRFCKHENSCSCRKCVGDNAPGLVLAQVSRMCDHLASCKNFLSSAPTLEKKAILVPRFMSLTQFSKKYDDGLVVDETTEAGSPGSVVTSTSFAPSDVTTFVQRISQADKHKADYLAAKVVHLEGLPFDIFQRETVVNFLDAAAPAYMRAGRPPRADEVGGHYLVRHSNEVEEKVHQRLCNADSIGLTSDGWTDRRGDGLYNLMICTPLPFFLGAYRTPGERSQKSDLLELSRRMIDDSLRLLDKKPLFVGFCTDSPNTNKGLRQLMATDEDMQRKNVIPYGCVAHSFENMFCDFLKYGLLPKIEQQVLVLCRCFKNNKPLKDALALVTPIKMLIPVDTRWASILPCFERVLRLREPLRQLRDKCQLRMQEVKNLNLNDFTAGVNNAGFDDERVSVDDIIESVKFWLGLGQATVFLRPLGRFITLVQSDAHPISLVPALFAKMFRCLNKVRRLPDDEKFPFSSLDLKPMNFFEMVKDVRCRWYEMTAHSKVLSTPPGVYSDLLHCAFLLDSCTYGLAVAAIDAQVHFDTNRNILEGIFESLKMLGERVAESNVWKRYC